jgi:hypothetical protein
MHIFMHRGHGGHGAHTHRRRTAGRSGDENGDPS